MNVFAVGFGELCRLFLGSPDVTRHSVAFLALGAAGCFFVMKLSAAALGMKATGWLRVAVVFALGLALIVAVAGAAQLYLVPRLPAAIAADWVLIGAMVLAVAIVVVPVQCKIQHGSYLQGFIAWLLGIAAGCLIALLASGVLGAARAGDTDLKEVKGRKDAMNRFLGQ